jgi:transcriptional regulator with XRE-family HTH domain
MNEFKEVTAENLRLIRGQTGKNQTEIADLLGIPINAVSKIESGKRGLSDTEKSLLDLYFFGKMPFEITNHSLVKGILEFTPLQWRVICIIATKRGMKPAAWIADRIRDYLAFNQEAREIAEEHAKEDQPRSLSLVAEEETPYRTDGNGNNNHATSGNS